MISGRIDINIGGGKPFVQDLRKDTNCSVNIRKFLSKIHHI